MPITDQLFGDDVSKHIKNCDNSVSVAKEKCPTSYRPYRGRHNFRGGQYRGTKGSARYQPYPQNMLYAYGGM